MANPLSGGRLVLLACLLLALAHLASAENPLITWETVCEVDLAYNGTGTAAFATVLNVSNPTPERLWEVNVSYSGDLVLKGPTGVEFPSPIWVQELQPGEDALFYGNFSGDFIRVTEAVSPESAQKGSWEDFELDISIANLIEAPINLTLYKHIPGTITYSDAVVSGSSIEWNVLIPPNQTESLHVEFSKNVVSDFVLPPARLAFNVFGNTSLHMLHVNATAGARAQIAVEKRPDFINDRWIATAEFVNPTGLEMRLDSLLLAEGSPNSTTECGTGICDPGEYNLFYPNETLGPGGNWTSPPMPYDSPGGIVEEMQSPVNDSDNVTHPALVFYAVPGFTVLFDTNISTSCRGVVHEPRVTAYRGPEEEAPPAPPLRYHEFYYLCRPRGFVVEYIPTCAGGRPIVALMEEPDRYLPQKELNLTLPDGSWELLATNSSGYVPFPALDQPGNHSLTHCWTCRVGPYRESYCISMGFRLEDCAENVTELQLIIIAELSLNKTSRITVTDNFGHPVPYANLTVRGPFGRVFELATDGEANAYFTPQEAGPYRMAATKAPKKGVTYRKGSATAVLEPIPPWCGDGICARGMGETHGNCPDDCRCEFLVFTLLPLVYMPCGLMPILLAALSLLAALLALKALTQTRREGMKRPLAAAAFTIPLLTGVLLSLSGAYRPMCVSLGGEYCWDPWGLASNIAALEALLFAAFCVGRHFYRTKRKFNSGPNV